VSAVPAQEAEEGCARKHGSKRHACSHATELLVLIRFVMFCALQRPDSSSGSAERAGKHVKFTGRDVHFYDLKSPPQHRRHQRFTAAAKADHSDVRKTLEHILSSKFQNSRLILEQKGALTVALLLWHDFSTRF